MLGDDVIDALVGNTPGRARFAEWSTDERNRRSVFSRHEKGAPWLAALLIGEMLTTFPMQYFEHELQTAIVLGLFIPLIISSGGNSGSQATSLIIRSLALEEIRLKDWWRILRRELTFGLALGVILGVLGILRVIAWQKMGIAGGYGEHYLLIALTVGIAVLGVVTFGSLAGAMLPFIMKRSGFDPDSARAPFVARRRVTGLTRTSRRLLILRGHFCNCAGHRPARRLPRRNHTEHHHRLPRVIIHVCSADVKTVETKTIENLRIHENRTDGLDPARSTRVRLEVARIGIVEESASTRKLQASCNHRESLAATPDQSIASHVFQMAARFAPFFARRSVARGYKAYSRRASSRVPTSSPCGDPSTWM